MHFLTVFKLAESLQCILKDGTVVSHFQDYCCSNLEYENTSNEKHIKECMYVCLISIKLPPK